VDQQANTPRPVRARLSKLPFNTTAIIDLSAAEFVTVTSPSGSSGADFFEKDAGSTGAHFNCKLSCRSALLT
jgi:hypothetical protein